LPALAALGAVGAQAAGTGAIRGTVRVVPRTMGAQLTSPEQVFLYLEDAPPAAPESKDPEVAQRLKRFEPSFTVVPAGGTVAFVNADGLRHNVFSPAPGNAFDLGLYPQGEKRSAKFDRPGIVPVYCNLHPQMIAYVAVVGNPHWGRPAKRGDFRLEHVPAGTFTLVAWTPHSKPERVKVRVPPGGEASIELLVRERGGPERHFDKHGRDYSPYEEGAGH
jgi:plastocyanin